jgi:hypothetical protein
LTKQEAGRVIGQLQEVLAAPEKDGTAEEGKL